jgi:hypothetical protein
MRGKAFWSGIAALAAGLVFVSGGGAASTTTVTLTVNSTTDSTTLCTIKANKSAGTCTLRGAILAADEYNHNDTIFVINLAAKTYSLTLGSLDVDASTSSAANIVHVVGTSGKKGPESIIDGSKNTRPHSVMVIESPTQMSNVVITGGSGSPFASCSGCGGGIVLTSALELENSIVRNNTACSAWTGKTCTGNYTAGGGIFLPNDGSSKLLTLSKTTVTHNVAIEGGGIDNLDANEGTILITGSHVDDNTACQTFSHGICTGDGEGGGLVNHGGQVTIDHSTVNGNVAGSPSDVAGTGGGILQAGGTMQLDHTTVSGNVAGGTGGGVEADKNVYFADSTVSHNVAGAGGGGVISVATASFVGTTFTSNTAGGTFECTIGSKTSCKDTIKATTRTCSSLYPHATQCKNLRGFGGGLYDDGGYPELVASSVTKNVAVTLAGEAGCKGGVGGGVLNESMLSAVAGSTFSGNTAACGAGINNDGTAFALANSTVSGNTALVDGGGIWTEGAGTGTLDGMTITGNKAGHQTGGVWDDQLGSVLFGAGNKITKNAGAGSCKNVTWPCS